MNPFALIERALEHDRRDLPLALADMGREPAEVPVLRRATEPAPTSATRSTRPTEARRRNPDGIEPVLPAPSARNRYNGGRFPEFDGSSD